MIKGLFTKKWRQYENVDQFRNQSHVNKKESAVWQRRFWEHTIKDDTDFSNHFDYLHYNPVKHGYVENVCDWPWSTFHKYVKLQWYEQDWGQGVTNKVLWKKGFGE